MVGKPTQDNTIWCYDNLCFLVFQVLFTIFPPFITVFMILLLKFKNINSSTRPISIYIKGVHKMAISIVIRG